MSNAFENFDESDADDTFATYIDTLMSEKNIDLERHLEVEGPSGTNYIPVGTIVDAIKTASDSEQKQIRDTLVMIDFKNGDVLHFIQHLGRAIAL